MSVEFPYSLCVPRLQTKSIGTVDESNPLNSGRHFGFVGFGCRWYEEYSSLSGILRVPTHGIPFMHHLIMRTIICCDLFHQPTTKSKLLLDHSCAYVRCQLVTLCVVGLRAQVRVPKLVTRRNSTADKPCMQHMSEYAYIHYTVHRNTIDSAVQ